LMTFYIFGSLDMSMTAANMLASTWKGAAAMTLAIEPRALQKMLVS